MRPFDVLSPGFVAVEQGPVVESGTHRSHYTPPAPFTTVELTLDRVTGRVVAGLTDEAGNGLIGFYDGAARRIGIELHDSGDVTVLVQRRIRRRPSRIAFVLCENKSTLLVDTGRGWHPGVTGRHRVRPNTDFRIPETLARHTATWGAGSAASGVSRVRAGIFGMAGLRDLHLVQHADGRPYLDNGRMYLTATCAGLGFFRQAHWGVFAFDPATLLGNGVTPVLEQTAHLFSLRDGKILGDHAGQVVRDGDRWLVAVSSWGDFGPRRGVHVRDVVVEDDILHGVHLLETRRTHMPTDRGAYDPGVTRVDGRWYVSYVESVAHRPSQFHPALAVGPVGARDWTEGLRRVGEADDLTFCEGPILARPEGADGELRLLASDGHPHARRYRVFDLSMRPVGVLDAPYGSNLPHPQVLALPDGSQAMVTFDGTRFAGRALDYGTHGDLVIMRAE